MIATPNSVSQPRLVFTFEESELLQFLLDMAIEQSSAAHHSRRVLLSARDRLDHLHAIATWLREDVELELPPDERLAITQLLQSQLPDHEIFSTFSESLLDDMRAKVTCWHLTVPAHR